MLLFWKKNNLVVAFLVVLVCAWRTSHAFAPLHHRGDGRAAAAFLARSLTTKSTMTSSSSSSRRRRNSFVVVSAAGPATIEKQDVIVEDKEDTKEAGTKLPAFMIRLWNDPFNKREFVARCLAEICGKSDTESFQIMMQAHQQGMGIVGRYDFEIAELYLQQLQEHGLLVDMVPVEDE